MDPVALTARWVAAVRARESGRADRPFDDPLAGPLAGAQGFAMLDGAPQQIRDNPYVPIRVRYFDDWALRVTGEHGVRQVVLVAAGLDTRAFRLDWPAGVSLWELDRPELLAEKEAALAEAAARPACERFVEGLLQYLAADEVDLAHPWMREYLERLRISGRPWRFGTNDPEALVQRHGWRVERVAQAGEEGAGEGRWPWPVAPRHVAGLPRGFLVTAVRPAATSGEVG